VSVVYKIKQKRKLKNGYRLSNKRFLVVAIGLLMVLILAVANMAYMVNYRINATEQSVRIFPTNATVAAFEAETATQSKIEIEATLTGAAP
jgi:hypothetical protein